jgi:exodeoxyribonuclease VIII
MTLSDGLHTGVSFPAYCGIEAVNHSTLELFSDTDAHAQARLATPDEATPEQEYGSAYHAAILEPDRFAAEYAVMPKFDGRTNAGKAGRAAWEAEHADSISIGESDHQCLVAMQRAAYANPTVRALLTGKGRNENTAIATIDGVCRKARPDRLTRVVGKCVIPDLKTCRCAAPREFSKAIHDFGYHRQGAYYIDIITHLDPQDWRFVIIAQEKVSPYLCACYTLDEQAIEQGRAEYLKHLDRYLRCMETNHWPGYPAGIMPLSLPRWATTQGAEE